MQVALAILNTLLLIYLILLFVRLVVDWIRVLARDWEPGTAVRRVLSAAYLATDPPIDALRRVLPSIRIGSVQLDLAFTVVFFVVFILYRLT